MSVLFGFSGRIGRSGFWFGVLVLILLYSALWAIHSYLFGDALYQRRDDGSFARYFFGAAKIDSGGPYFYAYLATVIPLLLLILWISFAIAVKRLHDRNRPGWLAWPMFFAFVPVGAVWWLIDLGLLPGTNGPNSFGPDPREHRQGEHPQTSA